MEWAKLLNADRFFWPQSLRNELRPRTDIGSSPFYEDAVRIRRSSAYRRLQGKTQVLPFPRTDYPRTRLTHTIEVCDVGRRLAAMLFDEVSSKKATSVENVPLWTRSNLMDIVDAACAAHDLGNPPFGHAGEEAMKDWFASRKHNYFFDETLTIDAPNQHKCFRDMVQFDGNAQGFRLLTDTQSWRGEGGMQLTLTSLASFCKYPGVVGAIKPNKYCFMAPHLEMAITVFDRLEIPRLSTSGPMKFARHPLSFLVEAADDIAYHVADLEDAIRGGVLSFEEVEPILADVAETVTNIHPDFSQRYKFVPEKSTSRMRYLGTHAITAMSIASIKAFLTHYDEIMSGAHQEPLLDVSILKYQVEKIKKLAREKIWDYRGKIENEVAGSRIISALLDIFGEVFEKFHSQGCQIEHLTEVERKIFLIFPWENYVSKDNVKQSRQVQLNDLAPDMLGYMLADFISGMTDRYSRNMILQLTGHLDPFVRW